MIKITRKEGTKTAVIDVPKGAYKDLREQGWVPFVASGEGRGTRDGNSPLDPHPSPLLKSGDELFLENIELKPISTWTKNEQKRYAKLKGLDQNAEDLRELIKEHIDGSH